MLAASWSPTGKRAILWFATCCFTRERWINDTSTHLCITYQHWLARMPSHPNIRRCLHAGAGQLAGKRCCLDRSMGPAPQSCFTVAKLQLRAHGAPRSQLTASSKMR